MGKNNLLASPVMKSGLLAPSISLGSSLDNLQGDSLRKEVLTKESGEFYQTGYHLYWIANYTGETLEYFVEEGKYAEWNSAKASVEHQIEHGQKIPLRLSRTLFKVCSIFSPIHLFFSYNILEERFPSVWLEHPYFHQNSWILKVHQRYFGQQDWRKLP